MLPLYIFIQRIRQLKKAKLLTLIYDNKEFIFLLLGAIFISFFVLKEYPFISLGDQVRDGGLNAYQILKGGILNLFDYGRYKSHGLIIPEITSFFYLIFANSVYTYRVAAAITSILDIIILYYGILKYSNKKVAFWGAIILTTSYIHLFYARTEIVVILSSLFTSIILVELLNIYKKPTFQNFALLGLSMGFATGLHASVRTVVFITMLLELVFLLYLFVNKNNKWQTLCLFLSLLLFYIIGFGPRILFTTPGIFLHTRTVVISSFADVITKYINSLLLYGIKPILPMAFHYGDSVFLFPLFLGIFFIAGAFTIIINNQYRKFLPLIIYALILPATNSAVTDCAYCSYRLLPLIPATSIIIGIGIVELLEIFEKLRKTRTIRLTRYLPKLCAVLLIVYFFIHAILFFTTTSASKGYNVQDYTSMHLIYALQKYKTKGSICLETSLNNNTYFSYLHIKEQYQYFLPNISTFLKINPNFSDNILYASRDCNFSGKFIKQVFCKKPALFTCDYPGQQPIYIFISNSITR